MSKAARRPATTVEMKLIRELYPTRGTRLCASALGRSESFVYKNAKRMGLKYKGARAHLGFIKKHASSKGFQWCADQIGYDKSHVAKLAKEHGIQGARKGWTLNRQERKAA